MKPKMDFEKTNAKIKFTEELIVPDETPFGRPNRYYLF